MCWGVRAFIDHCKAVRPWLQLIGGEEVRVQLDMLNSEYALDIYVEILYRQ